MPLYGFIVMITTVACCLATYALGYAECYADYLLDRGASQVNGAPLPGPFTFASYCGSQYIFDSALYFMMLPLLVVVANRHSEVVASVWMCIAILLAMACYSFIGSGGDRKGCVDCEPILFYFLLAPVPALVSIIYGVQRWRRESRRLAALPQRRW